MAATKKNLFYRCTNLVEDDDIHGLQQLVQQQQVNLLDYNHLLPLASRRGQIQMVKYLLSVGMTIEKYDYEAFRQACRHGQLKMAKFFLDQGADVHACKDDALVNACQNGHFGIVQLLYDHGADIHVDFDYGLRLASLNGHFDIVKYLIEKGADVQAVSNEALSWACEKNHLRVVKLLIENGANIYDMNSECFQIACNEWHFYVVKFLLEKGVPASVVNWHAIARLDHYKQYDILRLLVDYGHSALNLSVNAQQYIAFSRKMEFKKKMRAVHIIASWWIPIYYDMSRPSGIRAFEKNWEMYQSMLSS